MPDDDELTRISVRVGASHPELLADLAPLPQHARAERLRSLATAALLMLGHGGTATSGVELSQLGQSNAAADPDDEKRRATFESIRQDFDDAL